MNVQPVRFATWTRQRLARIVVPVLVLVACPVPPARAQAVAVQSGADTRIGSDVAIASFDTAWSRIRTAHYDSTFNGVNWDAVRDELRPRARAAATLGDLRAVILDMLSRLGESHYTLIPQEAADAVDPERVRAPGATDVPGDAGLELRLVEGRLAVWRVEPEGPAARAGVKPGWVVDAIDGREPRQGLAQVETITDPARRKTALTQFLWAANARLDGIAGTRVTIRFLDERDRIATVDLERRPLPGQPVRFGNLPTFFAELAHRRIERDGGCVGVISFNVWMVPLAPAFDRAMDQLRDCRGLVIDLRGNPGGVVGMVTGVSGHFLDERVTLGTMRARTSSLNFVANPRRVSTTGQPVTPFAGPLAILIDGLSVSTSEFFAGGMQSIGRARVFGETSAGQALPATLMRLPSGDVLMYVVADFTAAGGIRLEGRGVSPDLPVALTRAELVAGRDATLDAALAWISSGATTRSAPASTNPDGPRG